MPEIFELSAQTREIKAAYRAVLEVPEPVVDMTHYLTLGASPSAGQITSNTAELQAALDSGKSIDLPRGLIKIEDWLTHQWNGQAVGGRSMTETTIWQTDATKGVFKIKGPDSHSANPVGGASGVITFPQIRNLSLYCNTLSAEAGIITETNTDADWAGDGVILENLYIINFAIGVHIFKSAKPQLTNLLAKACTTGFKFSGSSNNTPSFKGCHVSGATVGLDIDACRGGLFELGDFANNDTHVQVTGGSNISIRGGQIEGGGAMLSATGSTVALEFPSILCEVGYALPSVIANAGSTVWVAGIRRTQHLSGTPLGKSTDATGYIIGDAMSDALGSTEDNSCQMLDWATGDPIVRISDVRWASALPTAVARMQGLRLGILPVSGVSHGDILTVTVDSAGAAAWRSMTGR